MFFGNDVEVLPPEAGGMDVLQNLQVKVSTPMVSVTKLTTCHFSIRELVHMSIISSVTGFSTTSSFGPLNRGSWCTPPRLFLEDQVTPRLKELMMFKAQEEAKSDPSSAPKETSYANDSSQKRKPSKMTSKVQPPAKKRKDNPPKRTMASDDHGSNLA